jgi:cytochrome b561
MCVSEESRAKNMSCAVVALYIIRIGLFLAFFSFLLSRERKKSSLNILGSRFANANVLVHFFFSFFFLSLSFFAWLIVYSYLLLSFFFVFSSFVVIEESDKKNERERARNEEEEKNNTWFQFYKLHAMLKRVQHVGT